MFFIGYPHLSHDIYYKNFINIFTKQSLNKYVFEFLSSINTEYKEFNLGNKLISITLLQCFSAWWRCFIKDYYLSSVGYPVRHCFRLFIFIFCYCINSSWIGKPINLKTFILQTKQSHGSIIEIFKPLVYSRNKLAPLFRVYIRILFVCICCCCFFFQTINIDYGPQRSVYLGLYFRFFNRSRLTCLHLFITELLVFRYRRAHEGNLPKNKIYFLILHLIFRIRSLHSRKHWIIPIDLFASSVILVSHQIGKPKMDFVHASNTYMYWQWIGKQTHEFNSIMFLFMLFIQHSAHRQICNWTKFMKLLNSIIIYRSSYWFLCVYAFNSACTNCTAIGTLC